MTRIIRVAAAQMGPVNSDMRREVVINRLVALLNDAADKNCDLVVFTELALTPLFSRFYSADIALFDHYYEREMPSESTALLFETACKRGVGFSLGYAELARENGCTRRFNTKILVNKNGQIISKYRKVHLPGHVELIQGDPFQNLEKHYFEVGNLGFPVIDFGNCKIGMCLCNDRRWPETYRLLRLQGAELIVLGYTTPAFNPRENQSPKLRMFHNHLCMQAGAYQNSCWVVGVAKAGVEDGVELIAGSSIISPDGEIVAMAKSSGDELIVVDCDLEQCTTGREEEFNFSNNRHPELYGALVETST